MESHAYAPATATRREWIGLAVIILPCFLYAADLTVLNLAVPLLSEQLRPGSAQLLWIIDIYGFMVSGCLITMGNLGDRIGRRKLLLLGAAAFGITSIIAAFSRTAEMLIAARALLGVAGATVAPSTLSLIRNMFHNDYQRTVAISIWIMSYSVGGAIAPLIGGVLLEHFWWGSVFLLSVPVSIIVLLLGPLFLPEYRDPRARRLDLTSAAMSLSAILMVIYGIKRIAEGGATAIPVLSIVAGCLLAVLFVRRQRALDEPLIDLTLFREHTFNAALSLYLLATLVAFGVFIFIAQYLQLVLGLSPLIAGLWTLPWSFGFIAGTIIVPMLVRRVHPSLLIGAGLIAAAIGFGVIAFSGHESSLAAIVAGSSIFSIGLSPSFILSTDIVMTTAPADRSGAAAAISETCSELGGVLGVAIMGSIGTAIYRAAMSDAPVAARATLGGALAVARTLPRESAAALTETARIAFVKAMRVTSAIEMMIVVAMAVIAFVVLRRVQRN
jgi:DHA2 family multidrug resistance protein-like MFS transporter